MNGVFLQIEAILLKMHGYPKFSFGIPRTLAKFCFLRINIPVLVGTTHRKPEYLEMRRTYTQ